MTGHTDGAHLIPQHHFRQGSINWVCESAQSGGVPTKTVTGTWVSVSSCNKDNTIDLLFVIKRGMYWLIDFF